MNGKSKCSVIHVGKKNILCPTLLVYGSIVGMVTEDTYLRDIISGDGKNANNMNSRVGKGLGIITEVVKILEKISYGQQYFKIGLLLRESIYLNQSLLIVI